MTSVPDRLFSEAELAAVYDLFNPPDERGDFGFYRPLMTAAPTVLDVGCGTGAMLHLVRAARHRGRLVGLDPAEGMITQSRRRADIEWVLGDLSCVAWDRAFDLVVMTGHAFQVLLTDDEIRVTLAAIHRALVPGGCFAFETRNPSARAWEKWHGYRGKVTDSAGVTVHMTTDVVEPFDGNFVSFTHTYASGHWREPKVSRSTLRFLDADALNVFLREAGFSIEAQYGDWNRCAITERSPEIITLARHPVEIALSSASRAGGGSSACSGRGRWSCPWSRCE